MGFARGTWRHRRDEHCGGGARRHRRDGPRDCEILIFAPEGFPLVGGWGRRCGVKLSFTHHFPSKTNFIFIGQNAARPLFLLGPNPDPRTPSPPHSRPARATMCVWGVGGGAPSSSPLFLLGPNPDPRTPSLPHSRPARAIMCVWGVGGGAPFLKLPA